MYLGLRKATQKLIACVLLIHIVLYCFARYCNVRFPSHFSLLVLGKPDLELIDFRKC